MAARNVEVVEGMYEAFGRGDVPAVLGAMAEDIEWVEAESLPDRAAHQGPQEVAERAFAPVLEDIPDLTVTPEELIGDGETIAAVVRYTGTGKSLDLPAVHVFDLRDSKVTRFREFVDTVKFLEVARAGAVTAT